MFIIFTIGRTGSSLLINILNNFEDITFSGEIYNIQMLRKMNGDEKIDLNDIRIFSQKDLKKKGGCAKNPLYFPKNTNYHKYFDHPDRFIKKFEEKKTRLEKLKFLMPQNKIVGCKLLAKSDTIKDFLDNYKNITKHFKIILLVRNNVDALRNSMKRAGFCSYKYVKLEEENLNYRKISEEYSNTYLLSYEDMLNRNEKFKGLFKFIGVPYSNRTVLKRFYEICSYAPRRDLFK